MSRGELTADGVLPVDKPVGPTSHDMVALARRALGTRRIGHTGTLDPFASGLMLLCIGRATRIAEYLSGMDKRYSAVVRLGAATDTDDHTGEVVSRADAGGVERADVEAALAAQRGSIMQVPPAYSAKKKAGERAYVAAREGRPVELGAVPVRIHELRVTGFSPPDVELAVHCSSGTYIRAIARDLGAALGVGAHLAALRRTAVGGHDVADALTPEALADPDAVRRVMASPLQALAAMPRVELAEEDVAHIRHGRALRIADLYAAAPAPADPAARSDVVPDVALAAAGELVAIARVDGEWLRPRKVFL